MKIIQTTALTKIIPEEGFKIYSRKTNSYYDTVYLGINDSVDDYVELEDPERKSNIDELNEKVDILEQNDQMHDGIIDTTMMAIDEIFMMIEPFLDMIPLAMTIDSREEKRDPMVELYVAMIQRGLKTLEQVPVRYRAEVEDLLNKLEN